MSVLTFFISSLACFRFFSKSNRTNNFTKTMMWVLKKLTETCYTLTLTKHLTKLLLRKWRPVKCKKKKKYTCKGEDSRLCLCLCLSTWKQTYVSRVGAIVNNSPGLRDLENCKIILHLVVFWFSFSFSSSRHHFPQWRHCNDDGGQVMWQGLLLC